MKKTFFYSIIAAAVLVFAFGTTVSLEAGKAAMSKYDFKLNDYNGNSHAFGEDGKAKAVAVIWVSVQCPVSNAYNERMEKLYQAFKDKGIAFFGINSNRAESAEAVKAHAKKNGLTFPILKDPNNVVADKYEASFTPEVYIFNLKLELLYHGRIDDSGRIAKVTTNDMDKALNEILAGKAVSVKETKAFGCSIKRVKK
ncbi:MAG: redoxin domain-containing protein [bacterium]|nr:redoxin domain-containing protein [bacterium]